MTYDIRNFYIVAALDGGVVSHMNLFVVTEVLTSIYSSQGTQSTKYINAEL